MMWSVFLSVVGYMIVNCYLLLDVFVCCCRSLLAFGLSLPPSFWYFLLCLPPWNSHSRRCLKNPITHMRFSCALFKYLALVLWVCFRLWQIHRQGFGVYKGANGHSRSGFFFMFWTNPYRTNLNLRFLSLFLLSDLNRYTLSWFASYNEISLDIFFLIK